VERVIATAWGSKGSPRTLGETGHPVVTVAARTAPDVLVATQDRVLRAEDLVVTLAVEAAVHHLDLVADPHRPGPRSEPLMLVRRALDSPPGVPAPADWPDDRWALVATGRVAPGGGKRRVPASDVTRIPLLGCG
jgi:hypothetical protein